MHILIDNQKSVDVTPVWRKDEDGDAVLTLDFEDTAAVMEAWKGLRPGYRNYRWGANESDTSPSVLIIAEALSTGLDFVDVDPHFDGVGDVNAYSLSDLSVAVGPSALLWGDEIDEDDDVPPLPGWAWQRELDLLDPDEREI